MSSSRVSRNFSTLFADSGIPEQDEDVSDSDSSDCDPHTQSKSHSISQDSTTAQQYTAQRHDSAARRDAMALSAWTGVERAESSHDSESVGRPPVFTAESVDLRSTIITGTEAFKYDIMVKHLRQRQLDKAWSHGPFEQGVVLKRGKDDFICKPADLLSVPDGFYEQIARLNVKVAMTVKTEVIESFLSRANLSYIPFEDGLRLQVLPDLTHLSRCRKHHYAAFIRDKRLLVVWDENPENIIARAQTIQDHLVSILWRDPNAAYETTGSALDFHNEDSSRDSLEIEKTVRDLEDNAAEKQAVGEQRRTLLWLPITSCCVAMLALGAIGIGWRKIAIEVKVDHSYLRLLLLIPAPLQLWLGWFFFQTIVSGFAQMLGPVGQLAANSRFYSGIPTKRIRGDLPHVTIQCPVYREGLWAVIDPTMASVRAAISTYEMQGGTANVFVNDDGMQLLTAPEARERIEYYEEHNIGWTARPKHNAHPTEGVPFIRPGKFKKASNMNYGLNVSVRVEEKMKFERPDSWSQTDEDRAYLKALEEVVKEDQGRTWAGGDIRIGDYILILDSDSRVPVDCFYDAVSEMEASPNVAIIQFSSGVMNVTTSFFEKGITFFTKLVFSAIKFAVASGDVAPFIGHNAILRWTAIQDIRFDDKGTEKYWSGKSKLGVFSRLHMLT